jgi:hypothetical protein
LEKGFQVKYLGLRVRKTGEWKELCKELHDLRTSQNTSVIKLRIRKWRDMLNTRMLLKMPTKFASVNQKGRHDMSYVG